MENGHDCGRCNYDGLRNVDDITRHEHEPTKTYPRRPKINVTPDGADRKYQDQPRLYDESNTNLKRYCHEINRMAKNGHEWPRSLCEVVTNVLRHSRTPHESLGTH